MQAWTIRLARLFSIDLVIYTAILLITFIAIARCLIPLARVSAKLRRASRLILTEHKQRKDRKSWRDLQFLGGKLEAIWADFLQNAQWQENHGESCDIALYVNEASLFDAVGNPNLAEMTPGLLTSLGILGTFLGLVQGLYGLHLDAADTAQLLDAMEQLIAGMSTAFLTSIAGVTASLLFNLLYNRQVTRFRAAIDRLVEVFQLYVMPKPISQQTTLLSLQKEQITYLRGAAEELGEKLSQQIEQSILRAMLPIQRSMDNFIVSATQAQVEGMDQVVHLFLRRMNVQLSSEMEHLRKSLADHNAQQEVTTEQMRAAMAAIAEMTKDVISMQQMSQGLLEHFKAYVTDLAQSRAVTEEQQRRTAEILATLDERHVAQSKVLEQMAHITQSLVGAQHTYEDTAQGFASSLQKLTTQLCADLDQSANAFQQSAHHLEQAADGFLDGIAGAIERASVRLPAHAVPVAPGLKLNDESAKAPQSRSNFEE